MTFLFYAYTTLDYKKVDNNYVSHASQKSQIPI